MGLSANQIVKFDRAAADAAAEPQLPAEPREEHLGRAAGSVLRPRLRYTVPYVVWMDGIGWRNDKIGNDIAGREGALGHPLGVVAVQGQGRHPRRRARRARDADAARRDRARACRPDLNTEDAAIIAKAGRDLAELTRICNVKVTITDYQTLPEGKTWLHHSWSGDLIAARPYYLPKGTHGRRALVLGPGQQRRGRRTTSSGSRRRRRSRCWRTRSSTSCSTRRTPTTTWSTSSATRPPQKTIDGRAADQARPDPEVARPRHHPARAVREQPGAARAQRRRRQAAGRTPGRRSRPARMGSRWTWRAARPPRRRLALALLPGRSLRGAVAVALGNQNTLAEPVPFWNPLDWNVGYLLETLRQHRQRRAVPDDVPAHGRVRRRSRSCSRS